MALSSAPEMDTLEFQFSSPLCWTSSKICNFLNAAHNYIKEKEGDANIIAFKSTLNLDALSVNIAMCHPEPNWKAVLGDDHFRIVTTIYTVDRATRQINTRRENINDVQVTQLTDLLRIIRNRLQHHDLISVEDKRSLNWFNVDSTGNGSLSKKLFVQYWTTKFPKLLPFLWLKFQQFQDSLRFYPYPVPSYQESLFLEILEYPNLLNKALAIDLDDGGIDVRYTVGRKQITFTLEFRTLTQNLILRILEGHNVMDLNVSSSQVCCKWYDNQQNLLDERATVLNPVDQVGTMGAFIGTIIIGNHFLELDKDYILEKCRDATAVGSRVCIFTNEGDQEIRSGIKSLVKKVKRVKSRLSENSVKWADLSPEKQQAIRTGNEFRFELHGNEIPVSEFIMDTEADLLSHLQGSQLQELLQNKVLKLMGDHELPVKSEIYLERRLSKVMKINKRVIEQAGPSDIFVFINTKISELRDVLGKGITIIPDIASVFKPRHMNGKGNLEEVSANEVQSGSDDDDGDSISSVSSELVSSDDSSCSSTSSCASSTSSSSSSLSLSTLHISNASLFLVDGDANDLDKSIQKGIGKCNNKRLFIVRYSSHTYQLVSTHCFNNSGILECKHNSCPGRKTLETDFIGHLNDEEQRQRLIVICDKPGMGKSETLKSFAQKLTHVRGRTVIFLNMSALAEKAIDKETVAEILCSGRFERELLRKRRKDFPNVHVELLLDGLDEVQKHVLKYAWKVLRVLQHDFPSVRVWLTARDHMLPDIQSKFGSKCLTCKLEPFSKDDQIRFLRDQWLEFRLRNGTRNDDHISRKLEKFAGKCVELSLAVKGVEITGVPFHCKMIAEINEANILREHFKIGKKYSLTNLYGQLFERKLEVYLIEKNHLSNLSMTSHIANVLRDDMYRMHVYFSLKLIFPEYVARRLKPKLLPERDDSPELESTVKDQGIIQNLKPLTFLHQSVPEFIVARFVGSVLTGQCPNLDPDDKHFQRFVWNEVLETKARAFKFANVCHFLNSICEEQKSAEDIDFFQPLHEIVDAMQLKFESKKKSILLQRKRMFDCVWELDGEAKMLGLIFKSCPEADIIPIFREALKLKLFDFCKFLIEHNPHCKPRKWNDLPSLSTKKYGVLHYLVLDLPKHCLALKQFKSKNKMKYRRWLKKVANFANYILSKKPSAARQKDAKGHTPAELLLTYSSDFEGYLEWQDRDIVGPKSLYCSVVSIFNNDGAK